MAEHITQYQRKLQEKELRAKAKENTMNAIQLYKVLFDDISKSLTDLDNSILEHKLANIDVVLANIRQAWVDREKTVITSANRFDIYYKLYSICGGKGAYQHIYDGRSKPMIEEVIKKNHEENIIARNVKIASKLTEYNVTKVSVKTEMSESKTGFSGWYVFETDKGDILVHIEVIIAGGYNIQCAHYRTLVHIKSI